MDWIPGRGPRGGSTARVSIVGFRVLTLSKGDLGVARISPLAGLGGVLNHPIRYFHLWEMITLTARLHIAALAAGRGGLITALAGGWVI